MQIGIDSAQRLVYVLCIYKRRQKMTIRILQNEDRPRKNFPSVALNSKLKRLTLNKIGFNLLSSKHGTESEFVQILVDDERPKVFWIRLCGPEENGAKKLDKPSPGTRSTNIAVLLAELNLKFEKTERVGLTWDEEIKAGRVDLEQPAKGEQ
jgi:hypothetical protein